MRYRPGSGIVRKLEIRKQKVKIGNGGHADFVARVLPSGKEKQTILRLTLSSYGLTLSSVVSGGRIKCMKPKFIGSVVVLLVSLVAIAGHAAEWISEEFKCAVTPPTHSDWEPLTVPDPTVKVAARTRDQLAYLFLAAVRLPDPAQKLDEAWITGFERTGFPAGKTKKTSGTLLVVQGRPAYKVFGERYMDGETNQTARIIWIVDGLLYIIQAEKAGGPPLEDSVIKGFVASFRFLNSTAASAPTPKKSPSTPSQPPLQPAADSMAQTIGTLTFFVILAVVVVGGVIRLTKKRS